MKKFLLPVAACVALGMCGPALSQSTELSATLIGPSSAAHKIEEAQTIGVPKGMRIAWEDDRLNPYTGIGTKAGKAKMELVWSKTVPRYLIDPETGKRVR